MTYIGMGSRFVTAAADTTGLNKGNYTSAFTPAVINSNVPYFEIHHMVVENVPIGSSAQIVINAKSYGFTQPFSGSEWDPAQPINLNPGDEIDFLWNIATSVTQKPQVTIWLRYDPGIPANARIAPGIA